MSNNYQLVPSRTPMFSPFWAKTPRLAEFLSVIWATPHQNWNYKFFKEILLKADNNTQDAFDVTISPENLALWMFTTETLINETRMRESSLILHTQHEIMSKLDTLVKQ